MAKYYGKIGFRITEETKPGIYKEQITEREYFGDVVRVARRLQTADKVNDDITLTHDVSVVADPFAYNNFQSIIYLTYLGQKWKVTNVEVLYPRLSLSLGGLYNG